MRLSQFFRPKQSNIGIGIFAPDFFFLCLTGLSIWFSFKFARSVGSKVRHFLPAKENKLPLLVITLYCGDLWGLRRLQRLASLWVLILQERDILTTETLKKNPLNDQS